MARNLRPAPFYLRPSVVRALVGDVAAIRKAVVDVPILPIKLVDQPGASEEITRFDAAHREPDNDETEQREPASAGKGCQPGRVAPTEESDPIAPAARDGSDSPEDQEYEVCGRVPVKESGQSTMPARGDVSRTLPVTEALPQPNTKAEVPTADNAGGCEGRAPEGLSRSALGTCDPVNARQPRTSTSAEEQLHPEPAPRPTDNLRNQARKRDVMYRNRVNADAREHEVPVDQVLLRAAQIRMEADQVASRVAPKAKIDWTRVAAAHRAKGSAAPRSPRKPLEPAPTREECPRCGIPGWKGCDHFLPCEDQRVLPAGFGEQTGGEQDQKKTSFTGRRQGLSVLRI